MTSTPAVSSPGAEGAQGRRLIAATTHNRKETDLQATTSRPMEGTLPDPYVNRSRRALPPPALGSAPRVPQVLSALGLCRELPPALFDIDDSHEDPTGAALAKTACVLCPVRAMCLDYALRYEPYGIWGGLDASERLARNGSRLDAREDRAEVERILDAFGRGMTAAAVSQRYQVSRRTVERWRNEARITAAPRTKPEADAAA
jgi:hypothetical protein